MQFWQFWSLLNLDFSWIFAILEGWNVPKFYKSQISKPLKMQNCNWQTFLLLDLPQLISRKICVTEKSWNFHTAVTRLRRRNAAHSIKFPWNLRFIKENRTNMCTFHVFMVKAEMWLETFSSVEIRFATASTRVLKY